MSPSLPPHQHLTARGKWPVVGEKLPSADALATPADAWTLTVGGLVETPRTWTLADLRARPDAATAPMDVHCVTRWSKPGLSLTGVPLTHLLAEVGVRAEARYISFVSRSARRHSSSLPLDGPAAEGTRIVWAAEGEPLSTEHGGPLRNMTPGKYLYKSVKWLAEIEILAEDRLGFWEAQAGYHNGADPWREQRYVLPSLTRLQARAILAVRDIRGREFVGLPAAGLDLTGLRAAGAALRNADFTGTSLAGADLSGANLSNATLRGTDLRGARLVGADLEGADLAGADLRGADLTGASLFGATFFTLPAGKADGPVPIDPDAARPWAERHFAPSPTGAGGPEGIDATAVARYDAATRWPDGWREAVAPVQAAVLTVAGVR